jgi:general secretion pathway protein E
MPLDLSSSLRTAIQALDPKGSKLAMEVVDLVLAAARAQGASDVHLQPGGDSFEIRWRIDGILQPAASLPRSLAPNVVARLKVLADLLTYRADSPQEGRIRSVPGSSEFEMRVSTFPTLHGEKAVVRLFAESNRYRKIAELGYPDEVASNLIRLLSETSGMILITGPAGSGKTTTIYACLREIVAATEGTRSLVSLEDPIEADVAGVAQSQVNLAAGFDLATGLRSLLRQDPEVIAVGEVRDRITAEGAFGASLTGHLVLTTFHAGSAAGAIGRLSDMGIEPYVLRSGLLAVLSQRLVRKLCEECSKPVSAIEGYLGLAVKTARTPVGCAECGGTGYRGRTVLAELLVPGNAEVARAILDRTDVAKVESAAVAAGMATRWDRARQAVERGVTSPAEVRRVLGFTEGAEG